MADLEVDLDGLEAFADALDGVRSRLDATRSTVRAARDDIGSSDLADALDAFEDHWHDGREAIDENGRTLTTMVRESVAAYRRTDADLASALSDAAAPSSPTGPR